MVRPRVLLKTHQSHLVKLTDGPPMGYWWMIDVCWSLVSKVLE